MSLATNPVTPSGAEPDPAAAPAAPAARPTRGRVRIDALDGVRAIAIVCVLGFHWGSAVGALPGGYIGVDVFFVLSGFLITRILWKEGDTRIGRRYVSFIGRRLRRLYPALLGLVVLVALLALAWQVPTTFDRAIGSALLVVTQAGPVAGTSDTATVLSPYGQAWSLAIEWYFYLVWPLVALLLRRLGLVGRRHLATALYGAAAAVYAGAVLLPWGEFYFSVPARVAQLLLGAALAATALRTERQAARPHRWWRTAGAAVAFLVLAGWTVAGPGSRTAAYELVGFPLASLASLTLVAACAVGPSGRAARVLAARPFAALGRVSYSLYLWHLLPVLVVIDLGMPLVTGAVVSAISTAALTALSYRFLEVPFLGGPRGAGQRVMMRSRVSA
jgi:peptidoglycan/LPS O-acetylase OafA/YrhL